MDDDVELSVLSTSLNNTNNKSWDDTNNDNDDDDNDNDDDEGPSVDIEYFDKILYEVSKDGYYNKKMANALKEKMEFLGKKTNVGSGSGQSKTVTEWEVIDKVDDEDVYFVQDNNFGIPGLDFNQLENVKYLLAEIFNHLWPGDPIEQLRKLNAEYASLFGSKLTPDTYKNIFSFGAVCFLLYW